MTSRQIQTSTRDIARSLATVVILTIVTTFFAISLTTTNSQVCPDTLVKTSVSTGLKDIFTSSSPSFNYSYSFLLSCMDVHPNPGPNGPNPRQPKLTKFFNATKKVQLKLVLHQHHLKKLSLLPKQQHHSERSSTQVSSNYFHEQSLFLQTMATKSIHLWKKLSEITYPRMPQDHTSTSKGTCYQKGTLA